MGLFKKLKKAFKKVTGFVKKTIKKTVKAVKKIGKKIKSSKILKALAIAAAVVVTGGAAVAAFTGGAGVAAGTAGSTFANWMMTTSQAVTGGTLFGKGAAMKPGVGKVLTQTGNFLAQTAAKPFEYIGTSAGNITRGVTDFTGLTDAASKGVVNDAATAQEILGRTGLTPEEINAMSGAEQMGAAQSYVDIKGGTGTFTMEDVDKAKSFVNESVASASPKTGFFDTTAGKATSFVGQQVGASVLSGAVGQYMAGDPETQGSMAGGAVEGAEYMDPLKVYAAQQGINTDGIYQHMMYGNQDPSSQYGNDLYRQQTFGVA